MLIILRCYTVFKNYVFISFFVHFVFRLYSFPVFPFRSSVFIGLSCSSSPVSASLSSKLPSIFKLSGFHPSSLVSYVGIMVPVALPGFLLSFRLMFCFLALFLMALRFYLISY
uniref:Uncharacterized protein n=1 Tax=Fundulus heteroclitus TaxID=8078 RepID=A0A146QJ78_FUNHE